MTRTSFVANVGGLLGLCMGFSLVSVAEIMYFCIKRHLANARARASAAKAATVNASISARASFRGVANVLKARNKFKLAQRNGATPTNDADNGVSTPATPATLYTPATPARSDVNSGGVEITITTTDASNGANDFDANSSISMGNRYV